MDMPVPIGKEATPLRLWPLAKEQEESHVSSKRASTVSMLVLFLGGCSASLAECLQDTGTVSTRGGKVDLPEGCRRGDQVRSEIRLIECRDGRHGFLLD